MLPHFKAGDTLPFVLRQDFKLVQDSITDFIDCRRLRSLPPVQKSRGPLKDPRVTEGTSSDHDYIGIRILKNPQSVFFRKDVTVCNNGNRNRSLDIPDGIPVGLPGILLRTGTSVDTDRIDPHRSAISAISTQFTEPLSQPFLILTVTGTGLASTTEEIILSASPGSRISAAPSPFDTIFGVVHPILMSTISAPDISAAITAALAIVSGSDPNICAQQGCSLPPVLSSARDFGSPAVSPLELTI